ncbi:MAG: hypothetical protein WC494_02970 [Candidatus Pacearchaeota archaeon]
MEKKGSGKYYIIISLILGLLVLSISFNYIFSYISSDELNWQECRQSIYLRSISPEFKSGDISLADLKDAFPLKCKTEVVTIDTAKPEKVYKKISDTLYAGWNLFGEGEFDIVPKKFLSGNSYCMVFARISYTPKSRENYNENDFSIESFAKYYRTSKEKNSGNVYNSYLPLYLKSEEGELPENFVAVDNEVKFYPNDNDLMAVYVTGKTARVISLLKGILGENIINYLSRLIGEEDKEYKYILLIPKDKINELDCEFLTIPA